jgi:anti-sigma regulatory factor (Ser/Thr protein kinase)
VTVKAKPRRSVHFKIPADPASLAPVRVAVEQMAQDIGFDKKVSAGIALAQDEALANCIQHGYGGPCDSNIEVAIEQIDNPGKGIGLRIVIRDFGKQVDPSIIKGRSLDDIRPGGLGTHIIRHIMDDVEYEKAEGKGMQLTIIKYLNSNKKD